MSSTGERAGLCAARRVVVKVGSALLAADGNPFARFAAEMHALRAKGVQVVLVSSGAIALGTPALGEKERPRDLAGLQAAAAAGQSKLMWRWAEAWARHGVEVAQLLLTHDDLRDRRRYLNARQAFTRLLDAGVLPIVNENDTVAVDEIKLGDNDTLAAQVCGLCHADTVVLLTGAPGLFTADPSVDATAVRVPIVAVIDDAVRALAGPAARLGTGGMATKLEAARQAQLHGAGTVIAPGREPDVLAAIFRGDDVGTWIKPSGEAPAVARKRWIGTALRPRGTVLVDAGAERALSTSASLLFAGVTGVEGAFERGDAVDVARASDRTVFARGLVQLSADDARRVAGMKSAQAHAVMPALPDELIHRDDLALV